MNRYLSLIAFIGTLIFSFAGSVSVFADEREALLSAPHHTSWAYFQDSTGLWYIANSSGNVYFLTPMKGGAGWGTIGNDIANLDFYNHKVVIKSGITNGMSETSYYDIGWNENVSGTVSVGNASVNGGNAYKYAQRIDNKTFSVKWYFYYNDDTGKWYIVNLSSNPVVYLFSSKYDSTRGYETYDWKTIDTSGISHGFFWGGSNRYVQFFILDNLELIGNDNFVIQTETALSLLKKDSFDAFLKIQKYIRIIEQGSRTGMWAYENPPRYEVDNTTAFHSITWYASTIAHDALHSELYHEYKRLYGNNVPDDVWTGVEIEKLCNGYQLDVLHRIGAPQNEIDYISSLDGTHCDMDSDGDCDWEDYAERNW